jgi:hypothetical protein
MTLKRWPNLAAVVIFVGGAVLGLFVVLPTACPMASDCGPNMPKAVVFVASGVAALVESVVGALRPHVPSTPRAADENHCVEPTLSPPLS